MLLYYYHTPMYTTTQNQRTATIVAKPCDIVLTFNRNPELLICMCTEKRMKTKMLWRYKFDSMESMQAYCDEQIAKAEREVARRADRKANKVKTQHGKVKITEEYTLYYNGIRKNGESEMVVKGFWSIQNNERTRIAFYARGYQRIPREIGAIQGCTIENETDSMTDYFDDDRLIITREGNEMLFDMVMQAFKQGQQ